MRPSKVLGDLLRKWMMLFRDVQFIESLKEERFGIGLLVKCEEQPGATAQCSTPSLP